MQYGKSLHYYMCRQPNSINVMWEGEFKTLLEAGHKALSTRSLLHTVWFKCMCFFSFFIPKHHKYGANITESSPLQLICNFSRTTSRTGSLSRQKDKCDDKWFNKMVMISHCGKIWNNFVNYTHIIRNRNITECRFSMGPSVFFSSRVGTSHI